MAATKSAGHGYWAYFHQGKIGLAYKTCYETKQLAEEIDDIFPKTFVYTDYGISCYGKGLLEEVVRSLKKGVNFCERVSYST